MALAKEDIKAAYPLPAYNYRVDVDGTTMAFSEVSGIAREHGHVTYKHGFSYLEGESINQYHYEKYSSITLKRGLVSGISDLYEWLEEGDIRPVDIHLCDEAGAPTVTWHIAKAVAVKLDAPSFTADTNDVAVESLEVMAASVSVEHHS